MDLRFLNLLSDVNFVYIWQETMITWGGLKTYSEGGDEATGIAGLAEALERELKGIRCEISVIADKIRLRSLFMLITRFLRRITGTYNQWNNPQG